MVNRMEKRLVDAGRSASIPLEFCFMSIKVNCRCGKRIAAKDEYAGRKVRCPACQNLLRIPDTTEGAAFSDETWDETDAAENDAPPRRRATSSPGRRSLANRGSGSSKTKGSKQASGSGRGLIIGLSFGGGVLVLAILALLLWPKAPAENVASDLLKASPAKVPDSLATPDGEEAVISIPRALSKLPDWLAKDAPFDLTEYWVEVPPDKNAAPLYLDALYEFDSNMEVCFPAEIRASRTPAVAERAARSLKLQIEWYRDSAKRDTTERDAVLQEHEEGFRKIRKAQQRPHCVFETGWDIPAQAPLFVASREMLRVAQLQVERDIEKGNFDSAVQMTGLMLRFGRDLRVRTPLAIQFFADAADSIIASGFVTPLLKSPALTAGQCEAILRLLIQHDAALREMNPTLSRLRGDYLLRRLLLHQIQNSTGEFAPSRVSSAFGVNCKSRGDAMQASLNADPAVAAALRIESPPPEFGQMLDALLHSMQAADFEVSVSLLKEKYKVQAEALAQTYVAQDSTFNEWMRRQQTATATFMAKAQSAVPQGTPPRERAAAVLPMLQASLAEPQAPRGQLLWMIWNSKFENDVGDSGFLGSIDARTGTRRSAMLSLAALRYWYATRSDAPADLASVCRAAGLTGVPLDHYGSAPLRMVTFQTDSPPIQYQHGRPSDKAEKFLAGETVIYSVGPDGTDDRAAIDWVFGPTNKGDWPFHLGKPQSSFPVTK